MENKYKNSYNLLQNDLKNKILMLDGAMGTMIQRENLTADDFGGENYEGCNDYLVLKRPDIIKNIHKKYLEAGSDIIETNSFGALEIVLKDYDLEDKVFEMNKRAAELVNEAIVPTFQLGIFSFVILIILSPLLGVLSAIKRNTAFDYIVQVLSYTGVSLPTFWLGYILIIFFSVSLKILPVSGRGDWKNFILPCITLVLPLIAQTTFFIRKNILEEMEKAHVENAIIRGVSKKRIILNHLLRNTSIPIITVLSSNIMYLLTGSVLIEEIFAWPGIGKLFTTAVKTGDFPLIQICLLFFGIMSIIVNEFTQVLVKYMDPRLRIKEKSKSGGVL